MRHRLGELLLLVVAGRTTMVAGGPGAGAGATGWRT